MTSTTSARPGSSVPNVKSSSNSNANPFAAVADFGATPTGAAYARNAKRLAERAKKAIDNGKCNLQLVALARQALGEASAHRAPQVDLKLARAAIDRAESAFGSACALPVPRSGR